MSGSISLLRVQRIPFVFVNEHLEFLTHFSIQRLTTDNLRIVSQSPGIILQNKRQSFTRTTQSGSDNRITVPLKFLERA